MFLILMFVCGYSILHELDLNKDKIWIIISKKSKVMRMVKKFQKIILKRIMVIKREKNEVRRRGAEGRSFSYRASETK
jgi:hypothetical protein